MTKWKLARLDVLLPMGAFVLMTAGLADAEWPTGYTQGDMDARISTRMQYDRGGQCGRGAFLGNARMWVQSSDDDAIVIVVRDLIGGPPKLLLWLDADGVWAAFPESPRASSYEAWKRVEKEWYESGKWKTAGFRVLKLRRNAVYGSPMCAVIAAALSGEAWR